MTIRTVSIAAQSLFYVCAGINHFWHPAGYIGVMPHYFPAPAMLVALSGASEIAGGLGLAFRPTRTFAAWGIAAMLVVFLTVHVDMLQHHAGHYAWLPLWLLWARLLFQPVFIAWALSARER